MPTGTQISSADATITQPSSAVIEGHSYPNYVSERSTLTVRVTGMSAKYGATVAALRGYLVEGNNKQLISVIDLDSNPPTSTSDVREWSLVHYRFPTRNHTIEITVEDSRGKETSVGTITIAARQLAIPKLNSLVAVRSTDQGVEDSDGNSLIVSAAGKFDALTDGSGYFCNKIAVKFQIREAAGNALVYSSGNLSITPSQYSASFTIPPQLITEYHLLSEYAYNIVFTATDAFGFTSSETIPLTTSDYLLFLDINGKAVGLGKATEEKTASPHGWLEINPKWDVYYRGFELSRLFSRTSELLSFNLAVSTWHQNDDLVWETGSSSPYTNLATGCSCIVSLATAAAGDRFIILETKGNYYPLYVEPIDGAVVFEMGALPTSSISVYGYLLKESIATDAEIQGGTVSIEAMTNSEIDAILSQ